VSGAGKLSACAAVLVIGLTACSDILDILGVSDQSLTTEEVEALFHGVSALSRDSTLTVISATSNGAVLECPLGGEVAVTLVAGEEEVGDTLRLVTDATLIPTGCSISSQGVDFVLDGNPHVLQEVVIQIVGFFEGLTFEGAISGGLDWEVDDRSGTCMIDLTLSAEPDFSGPEPQPNAKLGGMMCGETVEFDADDLVSP
jgi:hypothetical protein